MTNMNYPTAASPDELRVMISNFETICSLYTIRVRRKANNLLKQQTLLTKLGMSRGTYFKRLKTDKWTLDEIKIIHSYLYEQKLFE